MFASFWAAFDGRALSTSLEKERRDSVLAFLSALLECVVFYARRLWRGPGFSAEPLNREHSTSVDDQGTLASDSQDISLLLVREQWSRIWDVWTKAQFMLPGELFGVTLGQSLLRLYSIHEGERLLASGITSVLMTFIINRPLHESVGNNIFHRTPFSRAHKGYWCGGCLFFDR
jgi:hypothetical protein